MTTPQAGMPYGVTLNPSGMQGTFLAFENIPAAHRVGTSGLKLPAGVSIIRVVSKLAAAVRMQYIYNDGSPLNQFEIIPSGGGRTQKPCRAYRCVGSRDRSIFGAGFSFIENLRDCDDSPRYLGATNYEHDISGDCVCAMPRWCDSYTDGGSCEVAQAVTL